MNNIISCLFETYQKYVKFINSYVADVFLLAIRILIALVFYKSGLTKIANMDSTVLLFEYEYALPFVPPVLAAYSATFFELTCSVLLMAGLISRIAALPLIVMTLVIQLFVFQNPEHFYWLSLLGVIAIYGAGRISADQVLTKLVLKK